MLRISDQTVECMDDSFDLLLALDWLNAERFAEEITPRPGSLIIADPSAGEVPSVLEFSIVIPTFNRPGPLRCCLDAIARLDMNQDHLEVIVVDDQSPESQQSVTAEFDDRLNLIFSRQGVNQGPAAARNHGAGLASGRYVCFIDDDCMPHQDWLTVFRHQFQKNDNVMLGGHTVNVLTENAFSSASQLLVDYLYENLTNASGVPSFFTSNNMSLPLKLFRAVGGFDSEFPRAAAEDREFCHRFSELGYDLVYAPEALVDHAHKLSFRNYLRQHFFYGAGALQFRSLMQMNNQRSPPIESLSFYTGMLIYPFSKLAVLKATKGAALLLLSQVANTAGFFWQASRRS